VTITVQSSETLVAAPVITTGTNSAFTENSVTPTVTSTGVNSWKATHTAAAAAATKQWVKVAGTDINANQEIIGDSLVAAVASTADVVTFQADKIAPVVTVTPTSVEEGDIFIRVIFDEDEGKEGTTSSMSRGDATASVYTDGYKKVTLTSAKLKNKTSGVEEDVLSAFFTKDNVEYVLVKNLAKEKYEVSLGYKDEAGNTGTKTHAITVTARTKITISLTPGYNYFSLPGTPLSGSINDIIAAADPITHVFAYDSTQDNPWLTATRDATTGLFVGDISTLSAGQGYIAKATAFVDLKVDIPTASYNALPGVNQVKGGAWSLIGVATRGDGATVAADDYLVGTKWSVCVTYDPDPSTGGWTSVRPGASSNLAVNTAYFCYFREDGTIVQQ